MRNRKLWVSILAGILAAIMLLSLLAGVLPSYVNAERSSDEIEDEIDKQKENLKEIQAQISQLESQLSENMSKMEEIVTQKNLIDQEVFLLHQQNQLITQQIATYNDLIADKQTELDEAMAHLQQLNEKNKERIRAMEEDGALSYWSVLFKANSFGDLLDRLNMIEEIAAADRRRLEELDKAAKVVEQAKAELETEKVALEQSKKELEASQLVLEEKRAASDELLLQLVATGEEYQSYLDEAEAKESEAATNLKDLEAELTEAEEREYQEYLEYLAYLESLKPTEPEYEGTVGTPNEVGGLTWVLPISYMAFTSPFGYRWHPVYGGWRFHYGVDLAAPTGTPIVATRSGVVSTTSYEAGGAGYYVSVDHRDGFVTQYMHMTHYIVSPGEYVAAGQVLGYCGSTGASTGPHLHFSIIYNGTHVNPAEYINI
ncbi:MAG: peptidoglycan DD-metalloendopeptidase family protein [Oscillospiraceae bacterium]|nr:peptidoglycan DD-metalloendopeptidase family protein [Oscillospiraceae bacterium]